MQHDAHQLVVLGNTPGNGSCLWVAVPCRQTVIHAGAQIEACISPPKIPKTPIVAHLSMYANSVYPEAGCPGIVIHIIITLQHMSAAALLRHSSGNHRLAVPLHMSISHVYICSLDAAHEVMLL